MYSQAFNDKKLKKYLFEKFNVQNNCKVSKASTEIMLYRVCNGNEIDFPFSN